MSRLAFSAPRVTIACAKNGRIEQGVGGQPPFSFSISTHSLSNGGGATTLTFGNNFGKTLDTNHTTNHMSRAIAQKGANTTAAIAAMILFGILAFGSVQLKINGLVGDGALVSLLTMSGVFGLAIYFRGRLKKLGPSGLELHEAVREVKDAEASVKELAVAVLEVFDSRPDAYVRPESDVGRHDRAIENLRKLVG